MQETSLPNEILEMEGIPVSETAQTTTQMVQSADSSQTTLLLCVSIIMLIIVITICLLKHVRQKGHRVKSMSMLKQETMKKEQKQLEREKKEKRKMEENRIKRPSGMPQPEVENPAPAKKKVKKKDTTKTEKRTVKNNTPSTFFDDNLLDDAISTELDDLIFSEPENPENNTPENPDGFDDFFEKLQEATEMEGLLDKPSLVEKTIIEEDKEPSIMQGLLEPQDIPMLEEPMEQVNIPEDADVNSSLMSEMIEPQEALIPQEPVESPEEVVPQEPVETKEEAIAVQEPKQGFSLKKDKEHNQPETVSEPIIQEVQIEAKTENTKISLEKQEVIGENPEVVEAINAKVEDDFAKYVASLERNECTCNLSFGDVTDALAKLQMCKGITTTVSGITIDGIEQEDFPVEVQKNSEVSLTFRTKFEFEFATEVELDKLNCEGISIQPELVYMEDNKKRKVKITFVSPLNMKLSGVSAKIENDMQEVAKGSVKLLVHLVMHW